MPMLPASPAAQEQYANLTPAEQITYRARAAAGIPHADILAELATHAPRRDRVWDNPTPAQRWLLGQGR